MQKTVNILGTEYTIKRKKFSSEDCDGYCDYTNKIIAVRKDNYNNVGNFEWLMKKTVKA